MFPPPVRGLAAGRYGRPPGRRVSPARPGVGCLWMMPGSLVIGFPRPSGGWPIVGRVGDSVKQFPPPVRGLTLRRSDPAAAILVSPARPGVGPSQPLPWWPCGSFPRPSGGWPIIRNRPRVTRQFPPPVRGLARREAQAVGVAAVSPARPGVGPKLGSVHPHPACFPRPSGGWPYRRRLGRNTDLFPPPVRGLAADGTTGP